MTIRSFRELFIIGLAVTMIAGCSSTPEEEPVAAAEPEPVAEPVQAAPERPSRSIDYRDGSGYLQVLEGNSYETLQGVFYFDFDQAIVKRAAFAELRKHAEALAEDRSLRVRLEGHADERGTREYNLALGERRANAVRAYLMTNGALSSQLETISYGEEKPAMSGSNESAWAKNRRVELVYR